MFAQLEGSTWVAIIICVLIAGWMLKKVADLFTGTFGQIAGKGLMFLLFGGK